MYFLFKGPVIYKTEEFVVILVNGIGYQVYVSHSELHELGKESTLYLYFYIREDERYFVGFSNLKEKEVFLSLISVKGIGPRTAIRMLSKATPEEVEAAIKSNNITFFRKLPGVGSRGAMQILLDLRDSFDLSICSNPNQYDEVRQALKVFKFKNKEIDEALSKINIPNASNELILKEALKLLNKNE